MIKISEAGREHQNDIVDFQLKMAKETENLLLDKHTVAKGVDAVFDDPAKGRYYIAENNGQAIASLLTTYEWSDWRNGKVIWLQSVFVIPEFRRKGIFRQMYSYIKNYVEQTENLCGIRLYVDKTNEKAQKVYANIGMDGNHYRLFEDML